MVRSRAWASDTKPTPSSLSSYTEPMRPATIAPSDSRRQTQDDVELAPARRAEQLFSFWAQIGAGADIAHLHSDAPAAPLSVVAHGCELHGERLLVMGGDAGVEPGGQRF